MVYTLVITAITSTYTIQNNHRLADALTRGLERLGVGRWFGTAPATTHENEGDHTVPRRGDEVFLLGVAGESNRCRH